ncbi:MAG: hypothetical protein GTO41_21540 [Burkholderiales bacterium]|nr:hypothetical protein [Burkholderiales bacterium]
MQYRRVSITLNAILILISLLAIFDAITVVSGRNPGIRLRILEIKKVITIDEAKARDMDPDFSDVYINRNLGRWIARNHIETEVFVGIVGFAIAICNLVVAVKNKPIA